MIATVLLITLLQADSTAQIRGRASSSFNGRPLAGVMVSLPELHRFVVSDTDGVFRFDRLPVGNQTIRVSYEGRETAEYQFPLRGGRDTRLVILLDAEAVDLDPVVVEARELSNWRDLAGFYERRQAYRGFARFFTREEIDRIHPERISSILTLEGIATRCLPWCMPTRFSRGSLCAIPIDVNGMPLREEDYDGISVEEVAAVEVYRGPPPIGLSFAARVSPGSSLWWGGSSSSYETTKSCGLVAIWTR
jgi:hypothetical protein